VLYAIQATGNGHFTRAKEIIPILRQYCDLKIMVSGPTNPKLLEYPIDYHFKGLGFTFGKRGGIDFVKSLKDFRLLRFLTEKNSFEDIAQFDLVINDFEPVSAWAAYEYGVPCVSLGHQWAATSKNAPQPRNLGLKDRIGKFVMKWFAPSDKQYGFHYQSYNEDIFTPIIKDSIQRLKPQNKGHYLVYLPAHAPETICEILANFPEVEWRVFSKFNKEYQEKGSVKLYPFDNEKWIESLANCEGFLCAAGFQATAEALYLGKKLMVIPMKNQYEQVCNAVALSQMGAKTVSTLNKKSIPEIKDWLDNYSSIYENYGDHREELVKKILEEGRPILQEKQAEIPMSWGASQTA